MTRTVFTSLLLIITFTMPGVAGPSPPLTDEQFKARLSEATQLHDEGKYAAAIEAFEQLLRERPDDPTVLCEMGNTYLAAEKPGDAVRVSEKGLEQKTANTAFCSIILGSAYDATGNLKAGERIFRKAVKKSPDVPALRYNFGVNLSNQGRTADAIEQYEKGLILRPDHAGSWRALGLAWRSAGDRGRAFGMFARFLTLEPESPRSADVAKTLPALLFQGVTDEGADPVTGKKNININLVLPKEGKDVAGAHSVGLSLVAASRYTEEWEKKTDNEFFAYAFESVISILEEAGASDKKEEPFWRDRVLPYFREARAAGYLQVMAWDIRRSLHDPEIDRWIGDHPDEVTRFREWSKGWKQGKV